MTWTTQPEDHDSHIVERRIVEVMPLHAITALYGERGLRERFAAETARFGDVAGRRKAKRALQLAGRLHAFDHRQREPFVNHLLRVALRIMCHYGVRDADVVCAALLHDAIEDHAEVLSVVGRNGAFATLAATFGPQVADLVAAVTNPPYVSGIDEDEQYRDHVAASLVGNPWARVIKVSDFTDNGVGLIRTTGPKAVKLARKYAPLVPVLADLIAGIHSRASREDAPHWPRQGLLPDQDRPATQHQDRKVASDHRRAPSRVRRLTRRRQRRMTSAHNACIRSTMPINNPTSSVNPPITMKGQPRMCGITWDLKRA